MLITEFTVDHPVLREPLRSVPGIRIEWQQTYDLEDGPTQMVAWITSEDFEAVEAAIEADRGATNPTVLARVDGRRLYRFEFTDFGRDTNLMPTIVSTGGILREAVGTNDGWRLRVQLPDRESFEELYEFCRDHDIGFEFDRVFEHTEWPSGDEPALTEAQRETLVEAVESGYLEIPRECSLAELGDRLDVSETAASERFRRAVRNLAEQTVV